jgi:hypothetical protein
MTVSAAVIAVVYAAWTFLSQHTIKRHRTALFHAEVNRAAQLVATRIRLSPKVLEWHYQGVTLVSPHTGDTMVYDYYGEELRCNDVPVVLNSQGARIINFTIEQDPYTSGDGTPMILLRITVEAEDPFDNQAVVTTDIAARAAGEGEGGGDDGWDF